LRSKKSFGVVPHSMIPGGMILSLAGEVDEELQRSTRPVGEIDLVPASFIRMAPFSV